MSASVGPGAGGSSAAGSGSEGSSYTSSRGWGNAASSCSGVGFTTASSSAIPFIFLRTMGSRSRLPLRSISTKSDSISCRVAPVLPMGSPTLTTMVLPPATAMIARPCPSRGDSKTPVRVSFNLVFGATTCFFFGLLLTGTRPKRCASMISSMFTRRAPVCRGWLLTTISWSPRDEKRPRW